MGPNAFDIRASFKEGCCCVSCGFWFYGILTQSPITYQPGIAKLFHANLLFSRAFNLFANFWRLLSLFPAASLHVFSMIFLTNNILLHNLNQFGSIWLHTKKYPKTCKSTINHKSFQNIIKSAFALMDNIIQFYLFAETILLSRVLECRIHVMT